MSTEIHKYWADAKEYYYNAPDCVWKREDVIKIVESGKALKIVELGGLMFGEFGNYTFKFNGIPVKCLAFDF
jgi:hypothetical protein